MYKLKDYILQFIETVLVKIQNIYQLLILKFSYKRKKILNRNLYLKNLFKGQTIYILGNGPSVNKLDFKFLNREKTMVVNYFLENNSELNPSFLCILDTKVTGRYLSKYVKNGNIISLLNIDYYYLFKDIDNVYFSDSSLLSDFSLPKLNFNSVVSQTSNVIPHAIMWAAYMGFNKIVLLGCEFDLACYKDSFHFYTPDKRKGKLLSANMNYSNHLKGAFQTMNFHYMLDNYAKSENINIINSTPNSYIDAYQHKLFQNLYNTGFKYD